MGRLCYVRAFSIDRDFRQRYVAPAQRAPGLPGSVPELFVLLLLALAALRWLFPNQAFLLHNPLGDAVLRTAAHLPFCTSFRYW
jgi:hypothetical protein